jgi:hypothetical protein
VCHIIVVEIEEMRNLCKIFFTESHFRQRDYFRDLDVDMKFFRGFRKMGYMKMWTELNLVRIVSIFGLS